MTNNELPCYYIIGHSTLVKQKSVPLPENTCLLTYSLCGEIVSKGGAIKNIERLFFQTPRRFPHNVCTDWKTFKKFINDDNLRIKLSPAKYHNQITRLCSFWYSNNNKEVNEASKATMLTLARSGIYILDRTRLLSRNVDIHIPKQAGNSDIIVSRQQIGDIYAGALYPNVDDLNFLFGQNEEMPFGDFYSRFRKLTMRRKIPTLGGILKEFGAGAYFLTSACRSIDATKEEIDAMQASSSEADRVTQQMLDQIESPKLGLGTKRKRNRIKKTKTHKYNK